MNEMAVNLALIGRLIRWRWPLLLALVIAGAAAGAGASVFVSPGYISATKVLLQGSRDATQLPGETQVATSLVVLDRVAADLRWGESGAQLQHHVSALVDGNVITISGAADTPQRAQQLATHVTTQYVNFSTQIVTAVANATADSTQKSRQTVQQQIDDANKRVTQLQSSPSITAPGPSGDQARAELQQVQQTITKATKDLEQIDAAAESAAVNASLGAANATIIQLATLPESLGAPTPVDCVLGGALAAALLGLVAHLVAFRADRRLRVPSEIEAAAGAPVLGTVDVAFPRTEKQPFWRSLLHDNRQWAFARSAVAEDDRARGARSQRILRKLEATGAGQTVLVVIGDEDRMAGEVLMVLAVSAASGGEPVALVTSDEDLIGRVGTLVQPEGSTIISAGPEAPMAGSAVTFEVVHYSVARPVVPDARHADGALLLVSAGTSTGWELAAIAGACVDAGQRLKGVVVAFPGVRNGPDPGETAQTDPMSVPDDQAMAATS